MGSLLLETLSHQLFQIKGQLHIFNRSTLVLFQVSDPRKDVLEVLDVEFATDLGQEVAMLLVLFLGCSVG
jgi:hypothetical protein